jgi:glutamyl-tRNA synthetase
MNSITPRVRFAPSPTGYLHIGGLRTALYNYLFAKNKSGKLILRIEDTDRKRFVEGAVENLIDTLKWAGINFDEGPDIGGESGPYSQSERLPIYKELVEKLVAEQKAYYCFCTPERLEKLKEEQQRQKLPQAKYDKHCLSLSKSEIDEKLNSNIPFVIRLNVQPNQKVIFNDVIRETVEFDTNNIDDQVLLKSDGYPTYHLANVVDDHLMEITHVIRGEEWLSSTPKHIILYDYFEWEKPVFAHLPLLLNPDKSKLSKRQGDVAVEDYRDKGYLKEALINFVALLGWNFGDDKEFYEMDELIEKFSLARVHKAGAVFNLEKLNWLNYEHLRKKPDAEVLKMLRTEIEKSEFSNNMCSDDYLLKVITAMKERVSFVKEYLTKSPYFFNAPAVYEEQNLKKRWKEDSAELLNKLKERFDALVNPSKEDFEKTLDEVAIHLNVNKGKLVHPLRIAVSGVGEGPGVYDILSVLGKEETISRINAALIKLS